MDQQSIMGHDIYIIYSICVANSYTYGVPRRAVSMAKVSSDGGCTAAAYNKVIIISYTRADITDRNCCMLCHLLC